MLRGASQWSQGSGRKSHVPLDGTASQRHQDPSPVKHLHVFNPRGSQSNTSMFLAVKHQFKCFAKWNVMEPQRWPRQRLQLPSPHGGLVAYG